MPPTLTYPGVYIVEKPSGIHTITGVATSIATFIGWSAKGPTDAVPTQIFSWAEFDRQYGGLDPKSYLGYAVYHFFINGGQQAYIIRLVAPNAVTATLTLGGLIVNARGPGAWANYYGIAIKARSNDAKHFGLSVIYADPDNLKTPEVKVESFDNLSMDKNDSRFVQRVLEHDSALVTATVTEGATDPPGDTPPLTPDNQRPSPHLDGGVDGDVLDPDSGPFNNALENINGPDTKSASDRLGKIDLFNLLCVPGETDPTTISTLQKWSSDRRAFLIADCDQSATVSSFQPGPDPTITGNDATNAAFYFPWVKAPDPKQENRPREFPPCGFVAGIYARTDTNRGVWKAPAGIEASLTGISGVKELMNDMENGQLNIHAVNCIRTFPIYGTVVWGARTLQGDNERASEWKYIPVRRMALFIEETLFRSTKWAVFEPNDEPLWAQIRLNIGAFMNTLFRQGAFQGQSPREAYFVKCDKETTTQNDINLGIVNIVVGFAPLKPAEFVVITIQQIAGDIQV